MPAALGSKTMLHSALKPGKPLKTEAKRNFIILFSAICSASYSGEKTI